MQRPPSSRDSEPQPFERQPSESQPPAPHHPESQRAEPQRAEPPVVERLSATRAVVDGAECTIFAGCDYLGLSQHEDVRAAASEATRRLGTSCGGSRETTGTTELHRALEGELASFLRTESALVAEDGYVADLAVARGLAPRARARSGGLADVAAGAVLVDAEAHASLLDAARLTGAEVHTFDGDDPSRVHALLDRHIDGEALVLTDGAFTQSGRLARVDQILRFLPARGTLVVDDSHVLGVLRTVGRGSLEVYGLADERVVVTASLAKALGAAGGLVAGSAERLARIRKSAQYVATTALNPGSTAAALAALRILRREPERVERLTANTGALHRMARRLGLVPRGTFLPVLRLGVEGVGEDPLLALQRGLVAAGFFAPLLRYPGQRGAQLRFTVTSEHTSDELAALEVALSEHLPPEVRAS